MSKFDVNNVCDQLLPTEHINAVLGKESLNTTKIYVYIDGREASLFR